MAGEPVAAPIIVCEAAQVFSVEPLSLSLSLSPSLSLSLSLSPCRVCSVFYGRVSEFNAADGKHTVLFDDGDVRAYAMNTCSFWLLKDGAAQVRR